MPTVDFYSKSQMDTKLSNKADTSSLPTSSQLVPSTSGASSGDVLTFDGSSVGWAAGGGGGSGITAHTYSTLGDMINDLISHPNAIVLVHCTADYDVHCICDIFDSGSNYRDIRWGYDFYGATSVTRYVRNATITTTASSTIATTFYRYVIKSSTVTVTSSTPNISASDFTVYY